MADTFKGPPQKQGIIGRLALDRQLSDYGFSILVSIRGLGSETIQVRGESVSGKILANVEIQPERSKTIIPNSILQNGDYVIHIDDIKREWDNIVFIKSGSGDRVDLYIESLFDYV